MRDKREAGRERMADRKEGKLRALKKNVGEKGNQRLGRACKGGGCLSTLTIVQSYEIGIYIPILACTMNYIGILNSLVARAISVNLEPHQGIRAESRGVRK